MPFTSVLYDVYFQVAYRLNGIVYTDTFSWDHFDDSRIYGSVYSIENNKQNNNIYEGNVQITRSFSPPTHIPLFDPREGRGISIHHQLGSIGYYLRTSGNIDGLTPTNTTLEEYYGIGTGGFNTPIISVNSPRLYIGVRRTGFPKWFYIPAWVTVKVPDNPDNPDNYKIFRAGDKPYKTAVYVSGGDGLVDFDPIKIQGIPETRPSRENRVIQFHVSYMPNNVYYLFSSNDNINQMFSFSGNYEVGKLWMAHKSYEIY
jgi:hypothetical protein